MKKLPTKMREKRPHTFRKMTAAVKFTFVVFLLLPSLLYAASVAALLSEEQTLLHQAHLYEFQCFRDKDKPISSLNLRQSPVGLQVTDSVTHQLLSRIFAIFSREILNFPNIWLTPLNFNGNTSSLRYEKVKLQTMLSLINHNYYHPHLSMINLEVWMSPNVHSLIPPTIHEAGPSISPGRFGWFVPDSLISSDSRDTESLHYHVFLNPENTHYSRYIIDDETLSSLCQGTNFVEYQNPLCIGRKCVTLLAEHKSDTGFVEAQIIESNSYVNILWLGEKFREKITWLHALYMTNKKSYDRNKYIIVHWTPSDLIDSEIKYQTITMPKCEELQTLQLSNCKYELTPVLKYYSKSLEDYNERLLSALRSFTLNDAAFKDLQQELVEMRQSNGRPNSLTSNQYDEVACNWLKNNKDVYSSWISKPPSMTISIGGIFPISDPSRGHQNISQAVDLAERVINENSTILAKYDLVVQKNDGQCKADVVMKAFIHYFNMPNMLGVLGPACSETVEPIAGISKHTNMAVVSYSAEGATFADRQTYPYFFRTIGSNRQYEDVYIQLMQRFGWKRVAALTEDGQKYTEYISHMEANMKQRDLELIINKKFLSEATAEDMNKYLIDLKEKHAKIIIADIYSTNADLVLCEAYKLEMTAYHGYVWFLPAWLSKKWTRNNSTRCTLEELKMATEGHFSIEHQSFGSLDTTMQENITIREWLNNYSGSPSKYIGFVYDAVWVYALAADKLFRENKDAVNNLRSSSVIKRFVDLIWETDFEGLSGRVRFGQGGSRITNLNIMQWKNSHYHDVGLFLPHIKGIGRNMHTDGGELVLQDDLIQWLSDEKPPGDGTYDCSFSRLAEIFSTDCEKAAVIFTAIMCLMAVVIVSLVSFLFWKKRYDRKIKQSAKIMKTFGIDLLTPSRSKFNTLDKWEIPKENVVVNRRLGEGAFGTVYGGEAQLNDEGWTAVAVKTLKAGASTEDRLDFLSEAEAMKRFDNKNIVKLLGVCLQSEPIYTIMEFMLYGDLKTYLLARRHMVNNKISDESDISPKRLTMYAMDVAKGLAYLSQQKYVHRDIACRNCLVNAQRVVKLGDFGMARPIFESDYYRFNRKGMLPVRWMAPESLALGMFTPASDVWAFGVVLFEVITFGSFPFQGLTNNQVLEFVKSGKTLQIPVGVKPPLEGLLKACWSQEVTKRPTASDIIEYISNYPRLLTPCLDFPGASVQMPETESDELELLPKIRKGSPNKKDSTLDILAQATVPDFIEDLELSEHTTVDLPTEATSVPINIPTSATTTETDTFSAITPDGYSIMSPLLMHQTSVSSDSSQHRLLTLAESHQQTPF